MLINKDVLAQYKGLFLIFRKACFRVLERFKMESENE